MTNQSDLFDSKNIINSEGRYIQLDLPGNLTIVHVYIPNSGRGDDFIDERVSFEEEMRFILNKLREVGK